jgi:hypothetical protein
MLTHDGLIFQIGSMAFSNPSQGCAKDALLRTIVPGLGREQVRAQGTRIGAVGRSILRTQDLAYFLL